MLYLNHAGTSWPKPPPVQAAMAAALSASPLEDWPASFSEQHRDVAQMLGLPRPERLLLTPGCTSALALAVADLPWLPGDRVLTSGFEHHALHRPLLALEHRDVTLEVVPPAGEEPLDLEALEGALKRGRVRLVAVSSASNVTGAMLPVEDIIALAHAHGALVLVDCAQTTGWLPLPVRADILAFAGHKGPQAPWGIGGLYVAPGVDMLTPAARCDVPEDGTAPACADMPGYCDAGSVDRVALAGLRAGLTWLAEPEQRGRLARARRIVEQIVEGLGVGYRLLGPGVSARRMPTLALTASHSTPEVLAARLREHGIVAAAGLMCAPLANTTLGTAPSGVLRLSAGPLTPVDAADAVLEVLR